MSTYTTTPNDIDAFADLLRSALPGVITQGTAGAVEQCEDRDLLAWSAGGEAAFEIDLSNGASYQITLRQTAPAEHVCPVCEQFVHDDDERHDGSCPACHEAARLTTAQHRADAIFGAGSSRVTEVLPDGTIAVELLTPSDAWTEDDWAAFAADCGDVRQEKH
jgi:hypothetical protein